MSATHGLIHRRSSNGHDISIAWRGLRPFREDRRRPIAAHGTISRQSLYLFRMGKEAKHIAKWFTIKRPIQPHDHHMHLQMIHPSRHMIK